MSSRSTSESEEGENEESGGTPDPGRGGPLHPPLETRVVFGDMAYGGDAVGRDPQSGMALFAWPGIKGEEATVEITSKGKNLLRGVVRELHSTSPVRTKPPCPYFGSCGGCQWQHINYDGQVAFKQEILKAQLRRLAGIADPEDILRLPIPSPNDFNYRNTSHFAIDPATRTIGYFRRDSHTIIPVVKCPISNEGINKCIPVVNAMLADALDPSVLAAPAKGAMRVWKVSIRASDATGQTVVVFHSRATVRSGRSAGGDGKTRGQEWGGRPDAGPNVDERPDAHPVVVLSRREVRRTIAALSRSGDTQAALLVVEVMDDGTINRLGETRSSSSAASEAMADTLSGVSLARSEGQTAARGGAPIGAWIERLGGRTYWVAPEAFFQANTSAAELLLDEVGEQMPKKVGVLLDAHAGVGTFALSFAKRAGRVIGFEVDGSAVSSARWTAQANNVKNVEFRHGKAEVLICTLAETDKPDVVILDPPRSGCHPNLLKELANRDIEQIIYVSCDPSTLARDIKLLAGSHSLTSARLVDMFPQTYHLETVAVLKRR